MYSVNPESMVSLSDYGYDTYCYGWCTTLLFTVMWNITAAVLKQVAVGIAVAVWRATLTAAIHTAAAVASNKARTYIQELI